MPSSSSRTGLSNLMDRLSKYDIFGGDGKAPAPRSSPAGTTAARKPKTVTTAAAPPAEKCKGTYKNGKPCGNNVPKGKRKFCNTCGQFPGGARR